MSLIHELRARKTFFFWHSRLYFLLLLPLTPRPAMPCSPLPVVGERGRRDVAWLSAGKLCREGSPLPWSPTARYLPGRNNHKEKSHVRAFKFIIGFSPTMNYPEYKTPSFVI